MHACAWPDSITVLHDGKNIPFAQMRFWQLTTLILTIPVKTHGRTETYQKIHCPAHPLRTKAGFLHHQGRPSLTTKFPASIFARKWKQVTNWKIKKIYYFNHWTTEKRSRRFNFLAESSDRVIAYKSSPAFSWRSAMFVVTPTSVANKNSRAVTVAVRNSLGAVPGEDNL